MKIMWCWRCKQDVQMLDEEEYARVYEVYEDCIKKVKKFREANHTGLEDTPWEELYRPVNHEYDRIVGIETNFKYEEILKHRISIKGPPCKVCGKALNTPRAIMCMYCKSRVDET